MELVPAVTADELQQVLDSANFARIYDLRLDSFTRGECRLVMPYQECLERPGGLVSGSALMTLADVAMWLAIMTMLGKEALTVTTEMTTAFLGAARRENVSCTARVLKCGQRLIYGVAECQGLQDKLLAHHTVTYIRLEI